MSCDEEEVVMEESAVVQPKPKKTFKRVDLRRKIEVAELAVSKGIHCAARDTGFDRHSIRGWKSKLPQMRNQLEQKGAPRLKMAGAGRPLKSTVMEDKLLEYIREERRCHRRVSRSLMKKKATEFWVEMRGAGTATGEFAASEGWMAKFLTRNRFTTRRKTTAEQKDPTDAGKIISEYLSYVTNLRQEKGYGLPQIFAADETAIWPDDPTPTTLETIGAKSVPLLSTGHEKQRLTVMLAASANGNKLKPMILIPRVRPIAELAKFKGKLEVVYAGSNKNWMTEALTQHWLENVFGKSLFGGRRLLAWDAFKCHLTPKIKEHFHKNNIDMVVIPGGCTKYIQAPDVCWMKPFKNAWSNSREEWLRKMGSNLPTTKGGKPAPIPLHIVCEWVVKAWEGVRKEVIQKSFRVCGLALALDGSEDDEIACFAAGASLHGKRVSVSGTVESESEADDSDTSVISFEM